jgi:DNA-binding winged helix-turn-helix (wHTH) protein
MIYAFEGHELDPRRYELRCAGKPVKIEPQVFNILLYLVQYRARVVSKGELLEHLWPGRFVSGGGCAPGGRELFPTGP